METCNLWVHKWNGELQRSQDVTRSYLSSSTVCLHTNETLACVDRNGQVQEDPVHIGMRSCTHWNEILHTLE